MALPVHILQSTEIPSVNQLRCHDDYNPSNTGWRIGQTALLAWSVGLVPFKDDFWSSGNVQAGCNKNYAKCQEPNPVLETLVAALSTGPVGPSDSVGNLNYSLIMRTCTQNGLLLKADKPATAIDSTFLRSSTANLLQVWDSFTQIGNNRWHYILAADLDVAYTVATADIELAGIRSYVFDYFAFLNGTRKVSLFDDEHDLQIPNLQKTMDTASGVVPFKYYVIAPVLKSGWVLLGETQKFVTVSNQRITSLVDTSTSLVITFAGTSGEELPISLYNAATSSFVTPTPVFRTSTSATITCTTSTCTVSN